MAVKVPPVAAVSSVKNRSSEMGPSEAEMSGLAAAGAPTSGLRVPAAPKFVTSVYSVVLIWTAVFVGSVAFSQTLFCHDPVSNGLPVVENPPPHLAGSEVFS